MEKKLVPPTFLELARQALSSTERGYDLLAPKFDATSFRTPDWLLDKIVPHIVSSGRVYNAVDFGCGTGAVIWKVESFVENTILGVDFSAGMLEVLQNRAESRGKISKIVPFKRDFLIPLHPFKETFDVATCFGTMGHILLKYQTRFAQNVYDCLAPGGRYFFESCDMPFLLLPSRLMALGFNIAMKIRNLLVKPKFHMYYLTFIIPRAKEVLGQIGFKVEVLDLGLPRGINRLKLIMATKPSQ